MELSTEEKIVYQAFHAKAADHYANLQSRTSQLLVLSLNAKLELGDSNTHVATLYGWRQENIAAEWVYMVTKEDTDCTVHSTDGLMKFSVHGSPRLRLIFQQLLDRKVSEEVDKNSAWYAEVVLRAALVDARTFHSALEPSERDTLVNEFNDPQSTIRVLITTVILTSPGRSWAQEAQAAGCALRITSEFPLAVVRVATANSHDQFRNSKQVEKTCLQLAINRQDLVFRSIMLKDLKSVQSDVNLCHESQDGKVLLQRKSAAEKQIDQDLAQYLNDRQSERSDERLARKEANTRKRPVFNYICPDDEENALDDEYIDAEQPNKDDHIQDDASEDEKPLIFTIRMSLLLHNAKRSNEGETLSEGTMRRPGSSSQKERSPATKNITRWLF
ncbi:hypothetical protein N7537_008534 [Penicillium hordei]|uniref:Uncharacterized protein n=1 Tax=Penicillium hordei TaxID=40994 RepID=A0AAD6E111_9EURO|nr:uncharacterized protein N7537_008534 [Penicillium hordei]KAJ5598450.1 hypothetical protein N7537_008534 [Penicillium hordei]